MSDLKLIKPLGVQNIINKFCLTIGMIPSSYKLSLTYEEQILSIGKYLEETVIPALNNNAEAVAELQTLFVQLKDYVENYFDDLNVQNEVNTKLDEMEQSGALAEIINEQIFNELNSDIQNLQNEINETNDTIEENKQETFNYPYFDVLKNGGSVDGETPNDTIITNAKNNGYNKFYFPQNSANNANYYFTEVPNFNGCIIKTDEGVILNMPRSNSIDSTKTCILENSIIWHSRQQELSFIIPSNKYNLLNNITRFNPYKCKSNMRIQFSEMYAYNFDYSNTGKFVGETATNFYNLLNYKISPKSKMSGFHVLAVPIKDNNYCIETVTNGNNTSLSAGVFDSAGNGAYILIYKDYLKYFPTSPNSSTVDGHFINIPFNIGEVYADRNLPMKHKLKYYKEYNCIGVFVNDIPIGYVPCNTSNPTNFGFGFSNGTETTSDFSEYTSYIQEYTPLNINPKILIVGDSRTYGYNQFYKIEDILKNGLLLNGINNVTIENLSVSGYTIQQIKSQLNSLKLNQYDIVIVCTGINNFIDTYDTIATGIAQICDLLTNNINRCMSIVVSTMPVTEATDGMSLVRKQQYYKIANAVAYGCSAVNRPFKSRYVDNMSGNISYNSNIAITTDGVHPNNLGTIEFANGIINEILTLF